MNEVFTAVHKSHGNVLRSWNSGGPRQLLGFRTFWSLSSLCRSAAHFLSRSLSILSLSRYSLSLDTLSLDTLSLSILSLSRYSLSLDTLSLDTLSILSRYSRSILPRYSLSRYSLSRYSLSILSILSKTLERAPTRALALRARSLSLERARSLAWTLSVS